MYIQQRLLKTILLIASYNLSATHPTSYFIFFNNAQHEPITYTLEQFLDENPAFAQDDLNLISIFFTQWARDKYATHIQQLPNRPTLSSEMQSIITTLRNTHASTHFNNSSADR